MRTASDQVRAHIARLMAGIRHASHSDGHVTRAPFTDEVLARLPFATIADVDAAVSDARRAQHVWAETAPADRARVLFRIHDRFLSGLEPALDLMQWETGKARIHAAEEVLDAAINARHYAVVGPRLLRPRRRRGALPLLVGVEEIRHPKGVVGIVAPWNYPLTLAASDAMPALMAGNAVILRPDPRTALTALWVAEQFHAAGVPRDLFQVLLGDGPVIGTALIDRVDHIMFTGSTATGRSVAARAAQRLIGSSLELGGKNAMIIRVDADLDHAVEVAVRACFSSAGQLCLSIERMLVHRSVHDEFLRRFTQRVSAMSLSSTIGWGSDMGSLLGPDQLARTTAHIEAAVAAGAKVVVGGRARPDLGPWFHEPTVLVGTPLDHMVWREETFGPLVSLRAFTTDDEAVDLANDSEYGLNASIMTRDVRAGRELARRVHAGMVNINEGYAPAWASVDAPMGGRKTSGLGRRHGVEGLLLYTETQTVAVQRALSFGPQFGMTQQQWIGLLSRLMTGMRRLRLK